MKRNDDLLNVYGLLREKSSNNLTRSKELAENLAADKKELDSLTVGIDTLEESIRQVIGKHNLDIPCPPKSHPHAEKAETTMPKLQVDLKADYDFNAAFTSLVQEAHASGFTDTRPEDLLSEEDMRRVTERSILLDETFAAQTNLRKKDIGILMLASAIKIAMQYFDRYSLAGSVKTKSPSGGNQDHAIVVDAMQGVDLSQIKGLNFFSELLYSGDMLISNIRGQKSKFANILDMQTILLSPTPFNISDNEHFTHQDILGYDPVMGWLFGVINFMTNTVTFKTFSSYSVINGVNGRVDLGEQLSTPLHIMFPIIKKAKISRDSIVAAMIREADIQNVSHAPYETAAEIMNTMLQERDQAKDVLSYTQSLNLPKEFNMTSVIKDTILIAFIDMLTAALCSVMYNPDVDGETQYYTVRMHKVLMISNAFAAIANNIPAICSENVAEIDFASIFNTMISVFHSTKYWIEIKTKYLVSEHKKIIDAQLDEIDRYFNIIN